jgi:hypothetical protein
MPRRKPKITTAGGRFVVTWPSFGFAADEQHPVDSLAEAFAWIAERLGRHRAPECLAVTAERAYPYQDGVAAVPRWSTVHYRCAARGGGIS